MSVRRVVTFAALPTVLGIVAGIVISGTMVRPESDASHSHALSHDEALHYAMDSLALRYGSTESIWIDRNLADRLPNRTFAVNGAAPEPLSEDLVIGSVTSVEGGAGYVVGGGDADGGTAVAFDSPDAVWRVVELSVSVADRFRGRVPAGEPLRVGLAFDGGTDPEAVMAGLRGQRVVIALEERGFWSHDPALWSVSRSGALLGLVSRGGAVSFPVLAEEEQGFLAGLDTVQEIRAEAAKPGVARTVVIEQGVPRIKG